MQPPMNTTTTPAPEEEEEAPAAFVAIDWAESKHQIALLPAGTAKPECFELEHRAEALAGWIAGLRQRFDNRPVAIILEQKRGALIAALLGHEHLRLYPVNPVTLAKFRQAFAPSRAKDDPTDTLLLLEILLKHRDRLRLWKPEDTATRELTLLVEDRRQAVNEATRLGAQLLATLKGYFPQAIEILDANLKTLLACDLLLKWPTLDHLRKAGPAKLRRFLYGHNLRRGDQIEARLAVLQQAVPLTTDEAILHAGALKAQRLARQLRALLPVIDQYQRRIAELFAVHPDKDLFESLPGAGPVLAPRLLAAFGTQRQRWQSSAQIATFSGIAPVLERSGKHCFTHFRWAAPKFVRQSFHEFAASSRLFCPWANAFYQMQIAKGKKHHAAVRALAFKWIRILYRCWQDRSPYDPSRHCLTPQPA
jgi:transposase